MSRPIKFRAQDKNGKWHYSNGQEDGRDDIGYASIFWRGIDIGALKKETIGEFTGLSDKNGKEIWEGDVVRYYFYPKDTVSSQVTKENGWEFPKGELPRKEVRTQVAFKDDHAAWWPFGFHAYAEKPINLEVLGNIYEHGYLIDK